ncbi:MAG: hemerythrin domain-containing protein, partial [Brachybacterium sp.]|nr:hemerythrin domain-containing protein [Brachybacterium sp.]
MAEHVEIINATGDLRRACTAGDAEGVRRAATQVAALLDPHTKAEEVGLFSVMAEEDEFADHIHSLCGEHTTLDGLLAEVAAGAYDRVTAFEDALRHHIDREDNGLFPAAAIALSGPDWERVAAAEADNRLDHCHPHDQDKDNHQPHPHDHAHHHGDLRDP